VNDWGETGAGTRNSPLLSIPFKSVLSIQIGVEEYTQKESLSTINVGGGWPIGYLHGCNQGSRIDRAGGVGLHRELQVKITSELL
jgi:diaminopimelate decarboxylase